MEGMTQLLRGLLLLLLLSCAFGRAFTFVAIGAAAFDGAFAVVPNSKALRGRGGSSETAAVPRPPPLAAERLRYRGAAAAVVRCCTPRFSGGACHCCGSWRGPEALACPSACACS